jgi:hypothetical protein
MGYLDKRRQTVTAHFTKRGRELLADALSGATDDSYVITKFALGDDEVDYGLWDAIQPSNLEGRVIENMPVLESFMNQKEIMNSFILIETPEIPAGSLISGIQDTITFTGGGEFVDISPNTDNHNEVEQYEFFLEHDNLLEMYSPFIEPVANFNMALVQGNAPTANFSMKAM